MSDNQKAFLAELDALLVKYGINAVSCFTDIKFVSNGSELKFKAYDNGRFLSVETLTAEYCPPEPDSDG